MSCFSWRAHYAPALRFRVAVPGQYQSCWIRMSAFEDHTLLRAFVAIVECGSISGGARRLRLSQPGLSRQLRTLEERCGTALLRRDTHRMSVTETGRRLLVDAKAILTQADEADRRLRDDQITL